MFHQQPKLFQDPHIHYPIYDLNLDFAEYIRLSKLIVKETRQDLALNADFIIDSNSPFELLPTTQTKPTYGALLIHGLMDSPFIMRDIGVALQQKNMLVRAVALPGHSTVPGALLNVSYLDWLQAVRYGVASLKNDVEKIILVGYSTGAMLALLHTALEPEMIDRIIMLAPAHRINSPFAAISNWYKTIGWAWPRANWLHVHEEIDNVKYCSLPFNAVYQVHQLAQAVKKFNHSIWEKHPCFLIASAEDAIVSTDASLRFFMRCQNKESLALIYAAKKMHFSDERITLRSAIYPDLCIENFSHICLPIAPDNMHYGENGFFADASHVHSKQFKYGEQDAIDKLVYQFKHVCGLAKWPRRRLTFNPDFQDMLQAIEQFVYQASVKL